MSAAEPIDLQEVRRVAKLARLTLTDAEAERLTGDMAKILTYVKKLDECDTTNVVATSHAVPLPVKLRQDDVASGLPIDKVFANAPERIGDGFGVPKIIE
jgi:aspartyl-tRNA(Asn)/glutamyl-tRNA(Gln) amidotransferase subunit C